MEEFIILKRAHMVVSMSKKKMLPGPGGVVVVVVDPVDRGSQEPWCHLQSP